MAPMVTMYSSVAKPKAWKVLKVSASTCRDAYDSSTSPTAIASEAMLIDLAERLRVRGVTVELGHREKLALAASFRGKALVVETDAVVGTMSLRESLRLRPDVLRRLGWHYLRVHAFELFADPDAVATRIAGLLGASTAVVPGIDTETAPITIVTPSGLR